MLLNIGIYNKQDLFEDTINIIGHNKGIVRIQ